MSLNRVILMGRLTKDVELKTTPTGKSVATTSLATSKKWKDRQGQSQEKTEFHNLVIWQGAETFAKYVQKGHQVLVEGELTTRSWDDKQTGGKRYMTEVVVNNFTFLDNRQSSVRPATEPAMPTIEVEEPAIDISSIPF